MVKGLKTLSVVAAAVIALSSTAAFAQDAKPAGPQFTFGVSAWMYGTQYQTTTKDVNGNYMDYRIRPEFALTNGETTFKMRFEYDGMYGADANNKAAGAGSLPMNGDQKAVEVAFAYFDTKVKAVSGLTLMVGLRPLIDIPFVYGDNTPLVGVNYSTGGVSVNLAYIKMAEGTFKNSPSTPNDDAQMYWLDATVKADKVVVKPFFAVLHADGAPASNQLETDGGYEYANSYFETVGIGSNAILAGLTASVDAGMIGVDVSAVYGQSLGKVDEIKYSGYAGDLGVYAKLGDIKATVFGTYVSGDDGSSTTESKSMSSFYLDNHANKTGRRMFLFERAYTSTLTANLADNCGTDIGNVKKTTVTYGYLMAGFAAEAKVSDLKVKANVAYAKLAKVAAGGDKDLGFEFDLGAYYGIAAGTTVYGEFAFVKAGDAFGTDAKNPYAIIVGSTYKM